MKLQHLVFAILLLVMILCLPAAVNALGPAPDQLADQGQTAQVGPVRPDVTPQEGANAGWWLAAPASQPAATPQPHPILNDVRVRRAIAYCTDKAALLAPVYPGLTAEQRQAMIAATFFRPSSWAYTTPATVYPYAPATGQDLLEQTGWHLADGATYRTRDGKELVLTLRTTTSSFRVTFLTVFEAQMRDCGIRVIREHRDATWFFGTDTLTGIHVRDFELSVFSWLIQDSDPDGQTLYACDAIPMPVNDWQGQNYGGWCNAAASSAIVTATDTALSQQQRKAAYAVVIDAAATDLPYLPLFWRFDPVTGEITEWLEHIDFNLETYSQDVEVSPAEETTLTTTDYAGNTGSVVVPAGAVTQTAALSYYPLVASAYPTPEGMAMIEPFRLTAALQGVPQATFDFSVPVTLTVGYNDKGTATLYEDTLNLYRWKEGVGWQPAQDSCPEGQRYFNLDLATNTATVQICTLSEFALLGAAKHTVYLPLTLKNYSPPLRIGFGSNPTSLDPQNSSFSGEISVLSLIYEGLTRLDENLQTVPGAAESWAYNPTATELTFTLRAGLQYGDGTPLNAQRFAYSILRTVDPTIRGPYRSITDEIVGAEAYRTADVDQLTPAELQQLHDAVEVRALDSGGQPCASYTQADCRNLKLQFTRPAPYFHTIMSLFVTFPAKEELIAAGGDEWWKTPQYQIGNGPFVMTGSTPGAQVSFAPNQRYWKGQAAYEIEYRYMVESGALFAAYQANQLDIIPLSALNRNTVEGDPVLRGQLLTYPGTCTYALMFHNRKEPFTDHKVREAFAYALDRERFVREILAGGGSPTLTWIPKGVPGYDASETRWGYNPDLARQALAASSYGSAANLPQVTAIFVDSTGSRARWSWLIDRFREVLGIEVVFNPVSSDVYSNLTPQMYILGWCGDYPDPQNWLSTYWRTGTFGARVGYSNPAVDALLAQADAERDQATRMALYAQAQQMVTADLPAAYMWNNLNAYLVKPRVQGIKTTPQDSDWAGSHAPLSITLH